MIVYKVVNLLCLEHKPDAFVSSFVGYFGSYGVEYSLGTKTFPKVANTPLFAFESLSCAIDYTNGERILRCEAKLWEGKSNWHKVTPSNIRPFLSSLKTGNIIECYHDKDQWRGEILCEWIKPIEILRNSYLMDYGE